MQVTTTVLFAFFYLNLHAQECPKYQMAMEAGIHFLQIKNYDKALFQFQVAQVAARECRIASDTPAMKLKEVFEGLKAQRDNAERQKNIAVKATRLAFREREKADSSAAVAMRARKITEAQKEGFRLITVARQKASVNPTVALRIAEEALKKFPDSLIYMEAQQIYSFHSFYKTIITDSSSDFSPLVFSPDGAMIITETNSPIAAIRLWSKEGKPLKDFVGHTSPVTALSFSPDSKMFLSVSMDSSAILWNVNGKMLKKLKGKTGELWSAAFSPDGKTFATGSNDATVRLWDTSGMLLKEFKELRGTIDFISFSSDGTKILAYQNSDTSGMSAMVWNNDGLVLKSFGKGDNVIGAYILDTINLIIRRENRITLWNLASSEWKSWTVPGGSISSTAFSPDGREIFLGFMDSTVRLINNNSSVQKEMKGHNGYITTSVFSPDGMKMFSGGRDYTFRQWSREGELLKVVNKKASGVKCVAASPNGKMIFTSYEDSTAALWTGTGNLIKPLQSFNNVVTAASFSPNNLELITGSLNSNIKIWSINGDLLSEFAEPAGLVVSIVCSPDGTQVLTVSEDDIVKLWNTNGTLIRKYEGYKTRGEKTRNDRKVQAAAFTRGGIKILTSLNDRHTFVHKVKLWTAEGALLKDFKWPRGDFTSIRFSPDGTKILAAFYDFSFDKYAGILWDTSGTVLKEYLADRGDFSCIAFSGDGSKIISGSAYGNLKIWESMMSLNEFLKNGQIDELTPTQKKEFGIK